MINLTKKQLEWQDFVDNKIFELMQEFVPNKRALMWDIEMIGSVREEIRKQLVNKKEVASEADFYPYL